MQESTGNVNIGTGNLSFSSGSQTIQFANPGASSNPMINMFASGTGNNARMVIAHSPSFPTWGLQYRDNEDAFDFLNSGSSVMYIGLNNRLVGIGTATPERKLHVFNGSAGTVTANPNSPFVVENSTNNYISVLAPGGSERGILFGDNSDPQDGA